MAPLPADVPLAPAAEADDRLDGLRRAVAALPQPQREAMELRLVDGLSYEEIAGVLDVPVGTVRSRLHNAVQRLREEMLRGV
jgi:RNA polymerase sigma-70 factor (ECF subfamily)